MEDQLLFEMTANYVRNTIAMLEGEDLDCVPMAFSVTVERDVNSLGFIGENVMFGLAPANLGEGCIWAELTPGLEHFEYIPVDHHDDVGAEIAKLMIHRQEKVLAIFIISTGMVERRVMEDPTAPGEIMTAAVVAGQDVNRQTCIAHLPVTLLDGRLVVTGEPHFSMAHGHFSIFDRFWEVFRRKEKNFAAYN